MAEMNLIKQLRELTQAGIMDCKRALEEADGNVNEAVEILRRKGALIASKKSQRQATEGRIESYVHLGGKIGVLVEVNCETDFVAQNEEFSRFARDIAMQIAACSPRYISREDVPEEELKEGVVPQDFYKENCLLEQPFIKDQSLTVRDYLNSVVLRFRENISIARFVRYQVGEE
jgi:elongation factor Ts